MEKFHKSQIFKRLSSALLFRVYDPDSKKLFDLLTGVLKQESLLEEENSSK